MTWMLTPQKGCGDKLKGVSGISNTALVINISSPIEITEAVSLQGNSTVIDGTCVEWGARLERCLRSVVAAADPVVYVDSGSTDGSLAFACGLGGEVVPFGNVGWTTIFAVLAAITMTIGNIAALAQENIKRMLAYSSVAHAGVLLVGIVTAGVEPGGSGLSAVLFKPFKVEQLLGEIRTAIRSLSSK